jgi:hypothetical protein
MELVIRGVDLPGRDCLPGVDLHVALQVGREPAGLVPADAPSAEWRTELRLVERDGVADVRGPAVQGPKGDRFVYLTWGHVAAGGGFTMVRRAKLVLAPVLGSAARAAEATVRLTDEKGHPRTARVKPPAVTWTFEP